MTALGRDEDRLRDPRRASEFAKKSISAWRDTKIVAERDRFRVDPLSQIVVDVFQAVSLAASACPALRARGVAPREAVVFVFVASRVP
jgi:hypothetical protein